MPKVFLKQGLFESIDLDFTPALTFADPPDNIDLKYEATNDNIPEQEYRKLLTQWVVKCCEITKGPVFFCPNAKWSGVVERAVEDHNLKMVQRIIWRFTFGQYQTDRYALCYRPIYWLNSPTIYPDAIRVPSARMVKYGDKRANPKGKLPENFWEYALPLLHLGQVLDLWEHSRVCGTYNERRSWHKCQIPEALLTRVILGHSLPSDLIFDPFVGSGTTVIVAHRLGRDSAGLDASQVYLSKIAEIIGKDAKLTS